METNNPEAPLAVARPETTRQVSAVIKRCGQLEVLVVPQGGRTGLAGGAVPSARCIVLSF